MTRLLVRIAAPLLLAICAGCIAAGEMSKKLELGMTEKQVTAAIGSPSSVSMMTCGGKSDPPWPCKLYSYHGASGLSGSLSVFFHREDSGEWRVNHWSAY
jgi:hypothetical protein